MKPLHRIVRFGSMFSIDQRCCLFWYVPVWTSLDEPLMFGTRLEAENWIANPQPL